MTWQPSITALLQCLILVGISSAEDKKPTEADFYRLVPIKTPEGEVLESCGFQRMPTGELAVATRRGEIWLISDPCGKEVGPKNFKRFAHGLHECLSLAFKDGWLYVVQRSDVSRLKDTDGDGVADLFEVVNADWGISGDYHEYAFGSKFDRNGDLWVVLCLTGSFDSNAKYRGWCVRVTKEGKLVPTCSGVRSPGGMGMDLAGEMFYTDNQGPWNGACALKHLVPGKFVGHPGGFKWYSEAKSVMGPKPTEPESGSRMVTERKRIKELVPPAILFPYVKMGQSAAGIAADNTKGKFGPFAGQMFVGDQAQSTVMRCYLEKIDGVYQGACFPFREGISCGVVGLEFADSGELFCGGTARGWGSRGGKDFCIERLEWTGKTPFEIKEMRAKPDGFELVFTKPVDKSTASDTKHYKIEAYTHIYQASYGSPEVDQADVKVKEAKVADNGMSVTLVVDRLVEGHVHELTVTGVTSSATTDAKSVRAEPLLHNKAFYNMNNVPRK